MFSALIGPIANLAGTWFENKLAKSKADGEAKVAEAKARATVAEKVAAGGKKMSVQQLRSMASSMGYTLKKKA